MLIILTAKIVELSLCGAMEACRFQAWTWSSRLDEFLAFGAVLVVFDLANLLSSTTAACVVPRSSSSELAVVLELCGLLPRRFALRNLHARTVPKPPIFKISEIGLEVLISNSVATYLRLACVGHRGMRGQIRSHCGRVHGRTPAKS